MKTTIPSSKVRVAHLLNYLAPAGKELGLLKLIRNKNPEIFETTLIVTNEIRDASRMNLDGIRVVCLGYGPGNHPSMPLDIRRTLKDHSIDILHTHSWGTLLEGVSAAKFANTPIIIHGEHGTFPQQSPHRQLQRIFWSMCDRVLAVSYPLRKALSEATGLSEKRIEVILNGVESERFFPSLELREEGRRSFGFSDADFVVGTVGRHNKVKNQNMLIRAIGHLKAKGEIVHAMLVGSLTVGQDNGPELHSLVKELNVESQIHFIDFQKNINRCYNMFDVFALTSLNEGCSNVLQEAMFTQRSIIATDVGGNPDLIQHNQNGILVESNDHIELAQSILRLRDDTLHAKQLAENARSTALRLYPLDVMVRAYERVYMEEYYRKIASKRKFRKKVKLATLEQ
ncbi:MAG: glycosyltransferase [Calditrichota bacterium]